MNSSSVTDIGPTITTNEAVIRRLDNWVIGGKRGIQHQVDTAPLQAGCPEGIYGLGETGVPIDR
jgi:hypothetical protein